MSPSDQWIHVSEKIDELARDTNRQFAELRQEQKDDRHAIRGELQSLVNAVGERFAGATTRLTVIETERKAEAETAKQRERVQESATRWKVLWISLGVSLLGPKLVDLLKELFWWKSQ